MYDFFNGDECWLHAIEAITNLLKIHSHEKFFNSCSESLAKLLRAGAAALVIHKKSTPLKYKAFYTKNERSNPFRIKSPFPANEDAIRHVLNTGQPLFTAADPNDNFVVKEFADIGLPVNLTLPIPSQPGFAGVFIVGWPSDHALPPSPEKLKIAEMLAAMAGTALYRENYERQLREYSLTDALTGLPNRRMLIPHLEGALKRADRTQSFVAVCLVDLDDFKMVNDTLGHLAGDEYLVQVANAIRASIREGDIVARYGGDEFVVILENIISTDEADIILNRILKKISNKVNQASKSMVTASLGATVYPLDRSKPRALIEHADEAMYLAKGNGRNHVVIFQKDVICPLRRTPSLV